MRDPFKKDDILTIRSVLDRRRPDGFQLLHADLWLNSLTEAGYAQLRAATTSQRRDAATIVCAECEWPIYSPDDNRRRRYFQHRKGFPPECHYSGEGRDPRQVDADKFGGVQEGPRHKELKEWLRLILSLSKTATGIAKERHTRLSDGTFARPDVYAENWIDAPIAFDIQLATTQITSIIRREEFYERGGIRYVWITDSNERQLLRRGFRDIYMRNDGQIFGVDEEVLAVAREVNAPVFRIHRLVPGLPQDGFKPKFMDRIYHLEEINWGGPGSRPHSNTKTYDELVDWRCQSDSFISKWRECFYQALAKGNEIEAGRVWDLVQETVGGMRWESIPTNPDHAMIALGVLATLSTRRLCLKTRISEKDEVQLVNAMLLEPPKRRIFGELLEQLCLSSDRHELFTRRTVREKLERAKAETMSVRLARRIGPVYDAFIPHGSFLRLTLCTDDN